MHKMIFGLPVLIFLGYNAHAQMVTGQLVCNLKEQRMFVTGFNGHLQNVTVTQQDNIFCLKNVLYSKGSATQFIKAIATDSSFFYSHGRKFFSNNYSMQTGWFCRQEQKFENATGLPLKFRLGSVDRVDYLEGKKTRE